MEKNKIYKGYLEYKLNNEEDDILFLSTLDKPLAEELEWINGLFISIRYWITDKEITLQDAQKSIINQVMGIAETDFGARYSDYTGYLRTDEILNVGGHDLIGELRNAIGKYLILEITFKDEGDGR